jgi:hypothetical protein
MVVLATSAGDVWTEIVDGPRLATDGLGVDAGPLRADAGALDVDLGPGLHVRFDARREWARPFSPLGPAQMLPFLGQYWAPWLLGARVTGSFGGRSLDGVGAYAEKNWGAVFARHWWWGQAEFLAFAGGRVHGVAPTAVAVWTDAETVTLSPPLARTVARAGAGEWSIRASNWRWRVEITGAARDPLLLPVPLPRERRLEVRSRHHLLGDVAVEVRRGRRLWFRGESAVAALEDGATPA